MLLRSSSKLFLIAVALFAPLCPATKLFAVQNWNKESGPPLDLTWKSWRLVQIDTTDGKVAEVLGWHGGTLPNRGDPNGRLVGVAYDTATESRNTIVIETESHLASTYDVARGGAGDKQYLVMPGAVIDETQGFFTVRHHCDDVRLPE